MSTMNDAESDLQYHQADFFYGLPTEYRGISHCYACDQFCAEPDYTFCQGTNHQFRRSRCHENFLLDARGWPTKEGAMLQCSEYEWQQKIMREARAWHDAVVQKLNERRASRRMKRGEGQRGREEEK